MLCVEICSRLASFLRENERVPFMVHSVFEGAVNFKTPDGTIFALLAAEKELRPFTARFTGAMFSGFVPGTAALFHDGRLQTGGISVTLDRGAQIDLSLPARDSAFRGGQALLDAASELCGRGEGLTPAGDDFLCGVLLALHASGAREIAAAFDVDKLRGRTNDISLMYIRCARDGLAPRSLQGLLFATSRALMTRYFKQVSQFGASSGVDICAGIFFALSEMINTSGKDKKLQKKEAQSEPL